MNLPLTQEPAVIWEEVPEALKLFVVKARLTGVQAKVEQCLAPADRSVVRYMVRGPYGYVSAPEWFSPTKRTRDFEEAARHRLLCSSQDAKPWRFLGIGPGRRTPVPEKPRTYLFDLRDDMACRSALINIGLIEPPGGTETGRFSSRGPNLHEVPRKK